MDKNSILEYLRTVCDAESGIYACDEAINALKYQKENFGRTSHPIAPEKEKPYVNESDVALSKSKETHIGIPLKIFFSIVFWLTLYLIMSSIWSTPEGSSRAALLSLIGGIALGCFAANKVIDKINESRYQKAMNNANIAAQEKDRQAEETYLNKLKRYEQLSQIEDAVIASIEKSISDLQQKKSALGDQLMQLYNLNIIHTSFRNIIAVNQIREYMEMGVCNTLEGPDGAYAQYLLDIRTDKICSSIHDLKENLMNVLNRMAQSQALLVHEIKTTNNNVEQLNMVLSNDLKEIRTEIETVKNESAQQFHNYTQQTNSHLRNIEHAMTTAAYNQYIALRQSNVRNYLLKSPQQY